MMNSWPELCKVLSGVLKTVGPNFILFHVIFITVTAKGILTFVKSSASLRESSGQSLYWLQLPRSEEEQCWWRTVQLDDVSGEAGGCIVDFGLNVYEHDLIVVVSS
jgi:hypothetical protein